MAKDDKGLTPMMKQFFSLKAKHPEALMLFRCGDFYETYCEDAVTASRILGITLTRRNNGGQAGSMEMAGFPHHALDTYLPKLIRAGKRVAICDQLEDPKKKREQLKGKKGLTEMDKMVKRGITELVTPGVAMGDNVLNYRENNFLAAVHFGKTSCGVSFLDISTGEFLTGEGNYDYVEKLLGNFQPKEVLYDRARKTDFETRFGNRYCVFELDDWVFTEQTARQKLLGHFATKSLKGFGVDHLHNGVIAAGAIMQYLEIPSTPISATSPLWPASRKRSMCASTASPYARSNCSSPCRKTGVRCSMSSTAPSPLWAAACCDAGWSSRSAISTPYASGSTWSTASSVPPTSACWSMTSSIA